MTAQGHVYPLAPDECRQLLAEREIGRVAWRSERGMVILPVNYAMDDGRIVLRVSAASVLAELAEGRDVAFEVEDLDEGTANGWSVLVQGRAARPERDVADVPHPWAPGERDVVVVIDPVQLSGRSVSAD